MVGEGQGWSASGPGGQSHSPPWTPGGPPLNSALKGESQSRMGQVPASPAAPSSRQDGNFYLAEELLQAPRMEQDSP